MDDHTPQLVEHYHKTYDYTHKLWQERNRLFVSLLMVSGFSAFIALGVTGANDFLVYLLAGLFNIPDSVNISDLRNSFPFAILRIVLESSIFYLMVVLNNRTEAVIRNYAYLEQQN